MYYHIFGYQASLENESWISVSDEDPVEPERRKCSFRAMLSLIKLQLRWTKLVYLPPSMQNMCEIAIKHLSSWYSVSVDDYLAKEQYADHYPYPFRLSSTCSDTVSSFRLTLRVLELIFLFPAMRDLMKRFMDCVTSYVSERNNLLIMVVHNIYLVNECFRKIVIKSMIYKSVD